MLLSQMCLWCSQQTVSLTIISITIHCLLVNSKNSQRTDKFADISIFIMQDISCRKCHYNNVCI